MSSMNLNYPAICPNRNCNFKNGNFQAIMINNQCERCGHQPLSDLRLVVQVISLCVVAITIVSPIITYGALGMGVGGYCVHSIYTNRKNTDMEAKGQLLLNISNLCLMAFVSVIVLCSGLGSFPHDFTFSWTTVLIGFLSWPAGKVVAVIGLLAWGGVYRLARKRFTSPEAIEKMKKKQLEAQEVLRAAEASEAAVADSPVADSPVADSPVADSPVADSPVADSPVAETNTAEVTGEKVVQGAEFSMKSKKAELLAAAKAMGVDVSASMTKTAILEALNSTDGNDA